MTKQFSFFVLLLGASMLLFTACKKEEPTPEATFTVTIENVLTAKDYFQSGSLEAIPPGNTLTIEFNAGQGHYLSFATMLAQTNDLFYAPAEQGIALYNESGAALTGDITGLIDLWDAGTEVNQEPGAGADQAPRQAAPNTGADENGTVQLITTVNDGFTYPADEAVLQASLTHDGGTLFTLSITNNSGSASLTSPLAPGVWVVHGSGTPLFTTGEAAVNGLEALAEDGDNSTTVTYLNDNSGYVSPFAPGVWAVHTHDVNPLFIQGQADFGEGLEVLAEDGDAAGLGDALTSKEGVLSSAVFNTPQGASAPGPIMPGQSYEFTITASEGDHLSLATMLVHTNDLFYSFSQDGIELFMDGNPRSGEFTTELNLWDAGTEVNEFPGAGNNQPARGGANSGPAENGVVGLVDDGFTYPAVADAIRITITPQ